MNLEYVLITPARNEEDIIERTIKSVISQTILPKKWVIVSDGSTDRTDEIVTLYISGHRWIDLVRMPEHRDRQFAAKVNCFNAGHERVKGLHYDIIGNLDADISFEKDYLEFLLIRFSEIPDLGVAGTPFVEKGYSSTADSFEGNQYVNGGCQLFRRECFEDIGGYLPNKAGGIDTVAVMTARMKGWKTVSFNEKLFFHHRTSGTGGGGKLRAFFNYGRKDYYLGGHPVWEIFRLAYRAIKKPLLVGSLAMAAGYLWASVTRMNRAVSIELMAFHREEQIVKLKTILERLFRLQKIDKLRIGSKGAKE
jgi:glycosyltransferase involved in cell wall biosynthesis